PLVRSHNPEDNKESFVTHSGIKVQASSIGGQLRGSRFKQSRPDLLILDDVESAKNTNTQDLRDKNLHWFNSVIEPIGDPARTAILYRSEEHTSELQSRFDLVCRL